MVPTIWSSITETYTIRHQAIRQGHYSIRVGFWDFTIEKKHVRKSGAPDPRRNKQNNHSRPHPHKLSSLLSTIHYEVNKEACPSETFLHFHTQIPYALPKATLPLLVSANQGSASLRLQYYIAICYPPRPSLLSSHRHTPSSERGLHHIGECTRTQEGQARQVPRYWQYFLV